MRKDWRLDSAILLLRIVVGVAALYTGARQLFGLFGGAGYRDTLNFMADKGFHPVLGNLIMFGETLGGALLLLGLLTSVGGLMLAFVNGAFLYLTTKGSDLSASILKGAAEADRVSIVLYACLTAVSLSVALIGGGSYAMDPKFFKRGKAK